MDVFQLGPTRELSNFMKREYLGRKNIPLDGNWFFIVRLRDDLIEGSDASILKYGVQTPYRFRVIAILQLDQRLRSGNMYDFLLLIGQPIEFCKPSHQREIDENRKTQNRLFDAGIRSR